MRARGEKSLGFLFSITDLYEKGVSGYPVTSSRECCAKQSRCRGTRQAFQTLLSSGFCPSTLHGSLPLSSPRSAAVDSPEMCPPLSCTAGNFLPADSLFTVLAVRVSELAMLSVSSRRDDLRIEYARTRSRIKVRITGMAPRMMVRVGSKTDQKTRRNASTTSQSAS